jgi:hypothetical protein
MVVPVLMISCQVSLKPNSGPDMAQKINAAKAMENAAGRPTAREAHLANRVKTEGLLVTLIMRYEGTSGNRTCNQDCVFPRRDPPSRPAFRRSDLGLATEKALRKNSLRTLPQRHTIPSV